MNRKLLYLFLVFTFLASVSYGQSLYSGITCPPNMDFEFGNLSYWNFFRGSVSIGPSYSVVPCSSAPTLHTLTAGTTTDFYGGFPIVDPGGGSYALKLGKDSSNNNTDRAQYYLHIPAGANNYSIIYRYAVVMEDPEDHPTNEQPSFVAIAYDSATGIRVPCAQDTFYGNSPTAGLIASPVAVPATGSTDVVYKPWSTVSVNLSGLSGKTIALEFTAAGCTRGGHFCYGYVDVTCGLYAIDAKICDNSLATLTGPPGFSVYKWYDSSTFTHYIGGSQVVTLPIPDTATTYAVVVEPFAGFGCPDTLYTRVQPSFLHVNASNDTLVCNGGNVVIRAGATDSAIAMPLTYSWSPALYLSCTNCDNPTASPTSTTTYTVSVTDKAGCVKTDQVQVTIDTVSAAISVINDSCYGFNNGSATATPATGRLPFSYVWNSVPLQTGPSANSLPARIYTVTMTDKVGCIGQATVKITQPPANNISVVATAGPTKCYGHDGYIALTGLVASTTYTLKYNYNGSPTIQYRTANLTGGDTLINLESGLYDNITVDVIALPRPFCPYNTVGPITLIDPPTPPVPAVGNNGPLCIGDTLKLSANDAVLGVRYDWTGPSGFIWDHADSSLANADNTNGGVYTVTVTKNACSSSASTTVIIKPFPIPLAIGDTVCSGSDAHLFGSSANSADAYRWDGPNAYSAFVKNPAVTSVDTFATGVYTLTATLAGCKATTTASVIVVQTPAAPGIFDTIYCQYDAPVPALRANGNSLTWYATDGKLFPGIPTPATTVGGTFTWMVDQRIAGPGTADPKVCISAKATTTVKVFAKADINLSATDSAICTGNTLTFVADGLGEDKTRLRWSFAEGDTLDNVNPAKHAFDATGTYTVTATASHQVCATTSVSQVVHVYNYPVINLGQDTSICLGSKSISLGDKVNDGNLKAKWLWNTGETTPGITVTKPGIYYVTVVINGCPVSDTVTVLNDCFMNVPNAFSPDGDGVNDYFMPRQFLTKGLETFKMDIFNRWGQLVFSTRNINGLGWDGKLNDVPQPEGVYIYRIEATFKDGQIENHTGNVTLLR